ncbi:MAG: hypothetical protein ACYCZO_15055 [Daejeonella sp.]
MAILKGDIEFTGSLGNLSAYKMRGLDKTILRTKGGADKKKILKSPSFELTRQNFTEFGGCAKMGGSIRRSMLPLAPLADYNYTPSLSSLAKVIQLLDNESKRGERNIYLSNHRQLLNGFSLNRNTSFESIIKHPVHCSINRNAGNAVVQLPSLVPGINLITDKRYPLFRFIINLGCVADRIFTKRGYFNLKELESSSVFTDWHHTGELFNEREISIKLHTEHFTKDESLILSIGIQMGMPLTPALVNPIKYAGCAKIIAVA